MLKLSLTLALACLFTGSAMAAPPVNWEEQSCHLKGPIVCDPWNFDLPVWQRYDFTSPDLLFWAHAKCDSELESNKGLSEDERDWSPLCSAWMSMGQP